MADETKKQSEDQEEQSELSEEQLEDAAGGIIVQRSKVSDLSSSLTKESYGGPDARERFITDEEH